MKTGKSLTELATELERQQTTKHDYVADTRAMKMEVYPIADSGKFATNLRIGAMGNFCIKETAHDQLASRLQIPKKYYDRMLQEAPELLAGNVNHWFQANPEKRMVRVLDSEARAFLSERFRPLDNFDLAEATLPIIQQKGMTILSAELTERRMYIQAVSEKISGEVSKGDVIQAGIILSNSEIGMGAIKVEPLFYRLVCLNGMIQPTAFRKYHVGRSFFGEDEDMAEALYSDRTKRLDDAVVWNKVKDLVAGSLEQIEFDKALNQFKEAKGMVIEIDPLVVVEKVQKRFGLSDGERGSVLTHLIQGGDLSKWGLANAVTATANTHANYDRVVDLQRMGGDVIELSRTNWDEINEN